MSLVKIAGLNRIFSQLRIEAKLIENLLPLRLEDDELINRCYTGRFSPTIFRATG